MQDKEKIEKLNLIANCEIQLLAGNFNYKEKVESIERLLYVLKELITYEQLGLFEADPSAKELYSKFLNGKDAIIKDRVLELFKELETSIKGGIYKDQFLKQLQYFKEQIAGLNEKATKKDLLLNLIKASNQTIQRILSSPDEIIPQVLMEELRVRIN